MYSLVGLTCEDRLDLFPQDSGAIENYSGQWTKDPKKPLTWGERKEEGDIGRAGWAEKQCSGGLWFLAEKEKAEVGCQEQESM